MEEDEVPAGLATIESTYEISTPPSGGCTHAIADPGDERDDPRRCVYGDPLVQPWPSRSWPAAGGAR
jgi:hypothetical protein